MTRKYNWESKIVDELSEKYGLPKRLISTITHSQFQMISKKIVIEQKNIILPYFGKFVIKEGKRKFWEEYDKRILEKNNSDPESIQGSSNKEN